MLSQLDFADFLRSPGGRDESHADQLNFSLIPPTPQDRYPHHSFASHDFLVTPISTENHMFGDHFDEPQEMGSPPPPLGGILAPSSPHRPTRSSSLRAPSTHSRTSSIASSTSTRHAPYRNASRRTSGSSFSSAGNGSAFSTSYQSDITAAGLAGRLSVGGNVMPATTTSLSALTTGCIDQSAMLSLCPGEAMPPMTNGSAPTSNGETISLETPWTSNNLTEDTSDEEDTDDEDAEGEDDEAVDVKPGLCGQDESSDESEDSGSEYAEDSDEVPATKSGRTAAKVALVKKGSRAASRPVLQRDDAPILVTAITASGKKSHARKRPIDHIPRPRNAFILFRKHVVDSKLIPPEVEIRHQNISVVVSKMWAEADKDTKFKFQESARKEKEEHMRNYPNYKYQPVYRRANVARRKLKVDPIEEKKCEVVASLLIEGKQGEELEEGASKAVKAAEKRRVAQAAKLQALRKSASQNSLRREKAAAAKGKRPARSGNDSAVSSARSSPAPRPFEPPRLRQTLFPLAEQLLQSSSIVIQGQEAVEQAQLEGHNRARTSVSSMREMLPPGSETSTTYSSSLSAVQTANGMAYQGQQSMGYQPQMQQMGYQAMEQQQQQQQQQYVMPQQYQQYQQPQQQRATYSYGNISAQAPQDISAINNQYLSAPIQGQVYGMANGSHALAKNDPPSHYVLQLLSQGQSLGVGINGADSSGSAFMPSQGGQGQGMYEMDMSGYSEALAQMGVYGNM